MSKKTVISFRDVNKVYRLYRKGHRRLLSYVFDLQRFGTKLAIDRMTFRIKRGESVAVIGQNGAGKSTLLKMITGVIFPTTGTIEINGRVSAMLELTAGFDEAFTGRENIHIKGMLLGISTQEMRTLEPRIIDFADLGEYIDQPVRTYSSGMKSRLGFAINSHIDPDILVIDEALSVGDKAFRQKCMDKITEIRQREHVTVILVTHSLDAARDFCERGLVLASGRLIFDGPINNAITVYGKWLEWLKSKSFGVGQDVVKS